MEKEKRIICEFCNSEISIEKLRKHIKNKHNNMFNSLYDLTIYILKKVEHKTQDEIDSIIKDYEKNSVLYIDDKYNIKFRKYLSDLDLKQRSISESLSTDSCVNRRTNTFIKNYGVDNPSKSEKIKNKKKETFIKNYGVDNIWKLKEYRTWWEKEMIERYGKVCLSDLYGNENSWGWKNINEEVKEERIKKLRTEFIKWYYNLTEDELIINIYNKTKHIKNNIYYTSNLEKRIKKILYSNNIKFEEQKFINRFPYDFLIEDKYILEIQGTYWHCDNRFYNDNDTIKRNNKTILVSKIWEKDNIKKNIVEKYGYTIFYLWEYDINQMSDSEIIDYINNFIKK